MSFNKFMHPRNKYLVPPDFKQLAIEYPEFRKHLFQDLSGKLKFNFQDPNALRTFTKTLLHKDFGLNIEIPASRLVPTLPLRLNYILWIEDLLELNNIHSPVNGIDIGTGASCIYPILACKKNSWHMLALENDPLSLDCAQKNVDQNKLQDFIKVKNTSSATSTPHCLESWLDHDTTYHFMMCNPPFFASSKDVTQGSRPRQKLGVPIGRPPPSNAHTGTETELVAPGGEVAFVKNIVDANIHLQQIKIFTTMLGHKSSLITLKHFLTQHPLVKQISWTEFCQGNTMRWGIAWTTHGEIRLPSEPKRGGSSSKSKPLLYVMDGSDTSVEEVTGRVVALCDALKIIYKVLQKRPDSCRLCITAWENTWSKQRRRKRQNLHHDVHNAKTNLNDIEALKNDTQSAKEEIHEIVFAVKNNDVKGQEDTTSNFQKVDVKTPGKIDSVQNEDSIHVIDTKKSSQNDGGTLKRHCDTSLEHSDTKQLKKDLDIESYKKEPQCDKDVANGETFCLSYEQDYKYENSMKSISKSDSTSSENVQNPSKIDQHTNSNSSEHVSFINLPTSEMSHQVNGNSSKSDFDPTKSSTQKVGGKSKLDKPLCENSSDAPLVVCNLLIEELHDTPDGDKIAIEMIWVSGTGNRDFPHQILQYFKNHL